ncbi:MAG TPA: hypothetical protein PLF22_06695 [Pseudomonadales bacterium]|nr:hypothetical protein [Pseudomonadales bacterium]
MNETLDEIALRKQFILARSAFERLQIHHELHGLRKRLGWVGAGVATAGSMPVKSAILGLAIAKLGHGRIASVLSIASGTLLLAKVVGTVISLVKKPG